MSNEAFRRRFGEIIKKVGDKAEVVVRKTALELQTSMVEKSPVDTGRFRNNWFCGIGSINQNITDAVGNESVTRTAQALTAWKPGQTIFLTNSLPYSRPLEYGWSKQAPQGMVRLTVVEYSRALRRVVEGMK